MGHQPEGAPQEFVHSQIGASLEFGNGIVVETVRCIPRATCFSLDSCSARELSRIRTLVRRLGGHVCLCFALVGEVISP